MDRGAWRARARGVTESWTGLKQLGTHAHVHELSAQAASVLG